MINFDEQQPQAQVQAQPPVAQANPIQAQPAQPQAPVGDPAQGGQVDPMGFIKEVHDLLLVRIEAKLKANPEFGTAIDNGITPEAVAELFEILPEIKPIYDILNEDDGAGQAGAIQPQPQMQQPQQERNPLVDNGISAGLTG